MQTEWADVVDDLEALCEAWRLVASGSTDIEIVEIPTVPSTPPPASLEPRVRAILEDLKRVKTSLGTALDETRSALTSLRTASTAVDSYLHN